MTSTLLINTERDRDNCKVRYFIEGVNGVNRLATKGEKILLTTDKTSKKLPTSDKKISFAPPLTIKLSRIICFGKFFNICSASFVVVPVFRRNVEREEYFRIEGINCF